MDMEGRRRDAVFRPTMINRLTAAPSQLGADRRAPRPSPAGPATAGIQFHAVRRTSSLPPLSSRLLPITGLKDLDKKRHGSRNGLRPVW